MAALSLTAAACTGKPGDSALRAAPQSGGQLFDGMGSHHRPATTHSPEAQAYFDQGLIWTYAFNHDEAKRSFLTAAEVDPSLAIAWWGVALCQGPHINNPMMTEERSRVAWEALERARTLEVNASPREVDLIAALATRYAWPAPADRRTLDEAYAAAMGELHRKYPDDSDIATLYAESLMDLQPWDLWAADGSPIGQTLEIKSVLEDVLVVDPRHPGATHLYIHCMEASQTPERALGAADTLRTLVPASGHLTHMPSHIDARVGAWSEGAEMNRRAVAADATYRRLFPRQDFYRAYMQHNQQFLAFTCMMLGRSKEAIAAGNAALATLPADWIKSNAALMDGYMTVSMDALKRFGKWKELLSVSEPPAYLPFTRAMWRCNRAIAFAALGEGRAAEAERAAFLTARAAVPEGALAQINPAERVLAIAGHVLDGELAYANGDYASAERSLREAIAIEDTLRYMEPPDWMIPARHTLGAVLISAGRYGDAETIYREDLKRWPENGWSLLGLLSALRGQQRLDEAARLEHRVKAAWAHADMKPHASCLCAPRVALTPGS